MSAASFTAGLSMAAASMHTASENTVRKSGRKARNHGAFDTQLWVSEWRRLHPSKPVATVADAIGAPSRTVEKWFNGGSPALRWVGPIFCAYGATFVAAGMRNAPSWLREASRREQRERLALMQQALDAEFSDLEYAECEP